jgi:acid phosphatase type 7
MMAKATSFSALRRLLSFSLLLGQAVAVAQTEKAGPTFTVKDEQIRQPLSFITYGDQRFTDPKNGQSTPTMRQLLIKQIAKEEPAAVILNGDIPNGGLQKEDYAVYRDETLVWRQVGLVVIAALGNHEMNGDEKQCLENWWNAFPSLRNRRWYSTQLGSRVYVISLDSTSSLLAESEQAKWLDRQINSLSSLVDFVVITMHHPPVADVQTHLLVDHNPRPNEWALRDYLAEKAKKIHARFLVSAGHIHNYERHEQAGITYLVSGGGGAFPYIVERTPDDLYQGKEFPNYHYLKFVLEGQALKGVMYRVADPENPESPFEVKDSFTITAKARKVAHP